MESVSYVSRGKTGEEGTEKSYYQYLERGWAKNPKKQSQPMAGPPPFSMHEV